MEIAFNEFFKYRMIDDDKIETGNSTIYKAQDLEFNRTVCVKSIRFDKSSPSFQEHRKRAMLEVKSLIAISELTMHVPSVYNVYFDDKNATLYIIMQWINGNTLTQVMDKISPSAFLKYMIELCEILEKLEFRKMSHKDIKPSNIMITPDNEICLIDFNLSISVPNQVEGTQNYKAPEMDLNSRSPSRNKVDIFSVGVIMYQFFTGKIPVRGIDYAIQSRRRNSSSFEWDAFIEPVSIRPDLSQNINNIIVKCMKLNPDHRYIKAKDLKRDLIFAERSLRNGSKRTSQNR